MYKIYKVNNQDSIEGIARKFNTTVDTIRDLNGKDYIVAGELIIVPNNTKENWFDTYIVEKGDTLYSIASRYNISLIDLLNVNGLDKENYIYPGQEILVPKNNVTVIVTGKNDTINSVSNRLGVNYSDLLNQNDNILLFPDQIIVYKK